MTRVRFATTNIKHSEHPGEMAAAIAQVRRQLPHPPTVWAGQETNGASKTEWQAALGPLWRSVKRGEVEGFFNGTAIGWDATLFESKEKGVQTIYAPPTDGPYETYGGRPKKDWRRFASWVVLQDRDTKEVFSAVSVHGKLGNAGRAKQWDNLLALLQKLEAHGPVAVMGDFNDSLTILSLLKKAGYTVLQRATIDIIFGKGFARLGGVTIPKPNTAPHMDHPAVYADAKLVGKPVVSGAFRVGTFNILGATHTDPARGEHYAKKYKPWDKRISTQVKLMLESRCSVFGLQECQGPQLSALKRLMPTWHARTGTGTKDNVVFWDSHVWSFVSMDQLEVFYFGGKKKTMPAVVLRHRQSGALQGFLCVHNPANTHGEASALREKNVSIEAAYLNEQEIPFVFLGDFNSGAPFKQQVAKLLPDWKITSEARIDYILCPEDVSVVKCGVDKHSQSLKVSDHPLVWAELDPS